ncbi:MULTISPECIES: phosphotransferase [unclassified Kitasatospora]|uniref:maltokinase N-terminal cap-like domain-containing protein n=1 Tax=unclassified Kitasatospora TaxID=2633591 RepID=UPI000708BC9A|nr:MULTISPECIES: phosphotransferase [unclassified Kitasatospora]KQV18868.1 hypothetical protein ASC99_06730 [Kitasatospora sp. Root107]KRB74846.1 hypothetical protein ASE03_20660 [Kitasatospora sp. Root187]
MTTAVVCDSCVAAVRRPALQADELVRPLLPALVPWLVNRRWFAHERGCLQGLEPVSSTVLTGDPADRDAPVLLHLLLTARHSGSGAPVRRYQLLVGVRRSLPAELASAVIGTATGGEWDGRYLYEATQDPELMSRLLVRTAAGPVGELRLSLTEGLVNPGRLVPHALSVEQSNTSVVYGDRLMFKLLRSPEPGPHPEVETLRGLTEVGSPRTSRLVGWLSTAGNGGEATVLGVLTEFLPAEGNGWELAVEQAADCLVGTCRAVPAIGGFTTEARALGEAVAELHTALTSAFGRARMEPADVLDQAGGMERRLKAAVRLVPDLEAYAGRITTLYDDYAKVALRGGGDHGQRIHGDLHLGQVLRGGDGWKIIDFEGEPARPAAERGLPQPALRDVAGMLRSFDYAAQQALAEVLCREESGAAPAEGEPSAVRLRQSRRAYAWAVRNRRAFAAGYAAAGGMDPHCHPVALRAFEADKAVYEAVYEAQHRPDWLPIPLAAIQRLVSGR